MASESTCTIAELKEECDNHNVMVIPTSKNDRYLKEDFVKALLADYLVERFGELEQKSVRQLVKSKTQHGFG